MAAAHFCMHDRRLGAALVESSWLAPMAARAAGATLGGRGQPAARHVAAAPLAWRS